MKSLIDKDQAILNLFEMTDIRKKYTITQIAQMIGVSRRHIYVVLKRNAKDFSPTLDKKPIKKLSKEGRSKYKKKDPRTLKQYYVKQFPWAVKALERDGYRCASCGVEDIRLVVHHIDESRKTGVLNNSLENLISLCKPCHAKTHKQTKTVGIEMIKMRQSGMTLQKIGDHFGVTRERVRQLLLKTDLV